MFPVSAAAVDPFPMLQISIAGQPPRFKAGWFGIQPGKAQRLFSDAKARKDLAQQVVAGEFAGYL
jgi:hypothetical protein